MKQMHYISTNLKNKSTFPDKSMSIFGLMSLHINPRWLFNIKAILT